MSLSPLATPPRPQELASELVLEILRRHVPSYWSSRPIAAEMRLDDAGLGLDSVDLLDLLVACERELGLELPHDLLLDDAMTVGDLIQKLRDAARSG